MSVGTKKSLTDELVTVQLRVHRKNVQKVKEFVRRVETGEERSYSVAETFPEYVGKEEQVALRAYRTREGLTQKQLADLTGIAQHQISEMETGKRGIGKERARKLAEALGVSDYRVFL